MLRSIPLLAMALCLTFLAPVGRAAEHAADKDRCIKACDACRDTCKTMATR